MQICNNCCCSEPNALHGHSSHTVKDKTAPAINKCRESRARIPLALEFHRLRMLPGRVQQHLGVFGCGSEAGILGRQHTLPTTEVEGLLPTSLPLGLALLVVACELALASRQARSMNSAKTRIVTRACTLAGDSTHRAKSVTGSKVPPARSSRFSLVRVRCSPVDIPHPGRRWEAP